MPYFSIPLVNSQFIINAGIRDTKDLDKIQKNNTRYKPSQTYKMLVDTGATNTCIKEEILQDIGLNPTGQGPMLTAGTKIVVNQYSVAVEIPIDTISKLQGKKVRQRDVRLIQVKALGLTQENEERKVDGLLGMDVLQHLIWNYNGWGELSISFKEGSPANSNIGRNAVCPCGSGKKYKKCHGQND